ncbi:hypothetical protein B0H63DRAFT_462096 [Podospora didyma]|uniref:Uncharacterized protein n=1 Tax=Podospora didyma TaxID=330526 RepID=A0AAE0P881_9PEZI|nr:hypothetical protein B0H63DRAFT_462096 [Podospora didyma]
MTSMVPPPTFHTGFPSLAVAIAPLSMSCLASPLTGRLSLAVVVEMKKRQSNLCRMCTAELVARLLCLGSHHVKRYDRHLDTRHSSLDHASPWSPPSAVMLSDILKEAKLWRLSVAFKSLKVIAHTFLKAVKWWRYM